jgi:hypothetical protein
VRARALALAVALTGCLSEPRPAAPAYLGAEAAALDAQLVRVTARVDGGAPEDAVRYARCATAQFALGRGARFARHLRTSVSRKAGVRIADAVYTVSPTLPRGAHPLDAAAIVADCRARGIPTV